MAKPKLLIVEDDVGLCSQYRWAFPAHEVLIAQNRPQALVAAQKDHPPVVIMDLGLPPDPDGVSQGDHRHRQQRTAQCAKGGRERRL